MRILYYILFSLLGIPILNIPCEQSISRITTESVVIQQNDTMNSIERQRIVSDSIYEKVDESPEFPGGVKSMMKYLSIKLKADTTQYICEHGLHGRIIVSFIVEQNGSISSPKIEKGLAEQLDIKALSLVRTMPKWKPGKLDGKRVRVKCFAPVSLLFEY